MISYKITSRLYYNSLNFDLDYMAFYQGREGPKEGDRQERIIFSGDAWIPDFVYKQAKILNF